jgi:hypothetical protein
MYQCSELDTNNNCLRWVQVGFLGLPDISIDDANLLIGAVGILFASVFIYSCISYAISRC